MRHRILTIMMAEPAILSVETDGNITYRELTVTREWYSLLEFLILVTRLIYKPKTLR